MERREDEVAGERGLDADGRRLVVAHLTDHDHVGVGAKERAHGHGEREVDLGVHLDLPQAWLGDLDRVLRGPDLPLDLVDVAEGGVERRRLSRARGSDDEADAVGLGEDRLELGDVALQEAHLVQRDRLRGGEDAHDDVFVAAGRGDRRHAQLDGTHRAPEADLAVLGSALLGDVQLGHDLEALDEGVPVGRGHVDVLLALPVDSESDDGGRVLPVRLDVDVGSPSVVGIDDDLVAEATSSPF